MRDFINVIIGGGFTLLGVFIGICWDRHKLYKQSQETKRSILIAIKSEIETLWNRYHAQFGERIESLEANQLFEVIYIVSEQYFIIFNSNAHILGALRESELTNLIISTYNNAKGLVDTHRANNKAIQYLRELMLMNNTENIRAMIQANQDALIRVAQDLRRQYILLRDSVSMLTLKIDETVKSRISL